MLDSIRTARMLAQPLCLEDMRDICRMHADPAVMKYVGGTRDAEKTKLWFDENLSHWEEHGFGLWTFRDPESWELVGRCGLRFVQLDQGREIELGYSLTRRYWGQGLAQEMVSAALSAELERLTLTSVVALIYPDNAKSRRLAERIGFRFERDTVWKSEAAMVYRLETARVRYKSASA